MGRSVDLSMSTRTRQYLVAGFVSLVASSLVIQVVATVVSLPFVVAAPVGFVGWLSLTVLWVRRLGGSGGGSAWDAIPRWQYGGRHAGAGGHSKSGQEDALGPDEG